MDFPKKNLNYIEMTEKSVGNERRVEILNGMVDKSTLMPKPVVYEDIDMAVKEWVNSLSIVTDEGKEYPTMTLFSNQRFSEYSQTWKYTDENNNMMLNFKTVTRENNPQYGKIQSGLWNIPDGGDRFYLMKRMKVLDDNGTESYIDLKCKQPVAIDLIYKISIFTTKFQSVNQFNIKMNKVFKARQHYVRPNGYYMPMTLQNISDSSEYSIDDRQFYSQTYEIKLMGFILEESDFRLDEVPLKRGLSFPMMIRKKKTPEVEIEECENKIKKNGYEYVQTNIEILFPDCVNSAEFEMDADMVITGYKYNNLVTSCRIFINEDEVETSNIVNIKEHDKLKILVKHRNILKDATLTLEGYDPNNANKVSDLNNMTSDSDLSPLELLRQTINNIGRKTIS